MFKIKIPRTKRGPTTIRRYGQVKIRSGKSIGKMIGKWRMRYPRKAG